MGDTPSPARQAHPAIANLERSHVWAGDHADATRVLDEIDRLRAERDRWRERAERAEQAIDALRQDYCERDTSGLGACFRYGDKQIRAKYGADQACVPCIIEHLAPVRLRSVSDTPKSAAGAVIDTETYPAGLVVNTGWDAAEVGGESIADVYTAEGRPRSRRSPARRSFCSLTRQGARRCLGVGTRHGASTTSAT